MANAAKEINFFAAEAKLIFAAAAVMLFIAGLALKPWSDLWILTGLLCLLFIAAAMKMHFFGNQKKSVARKKK